MAKTADRATGDGPQPKHLAKELGKHLREVRRLQGLSRSEVARSAGLTRRELAAYERGRTPVPESDLWCLAGSCGVDVAELLPHRPPLTVGSDLSSLAVGDTIRHLRSPGSANGMLREYLSMVYELRNLPPGSRVPLRETDLVALADALGGTPGMIESRLVELIGASRDEAARLRAMILPPLPLPSGSGTTDDPYAVLSDDRAVVGEVVDFFSTARAEDPFAPPPEPLSALTYDPFAAPADATQPFQPAPVDPFAAPTDATQVWQPAPIDPFAAAGPTGNGHDTPGDDAPGTTFLEAPFGGDHDDTIVVDDPTALDYAIVEDAIAIDDPTAPLEVESEALLPIAWFAPDGAASPVEMITRHASGPSWRVGGMFPATAMADDGTLSLRRADTRWALSDVAAPGDVTIEVTFDFTAGAGFGVLLRASVDDAHGLNGYSLDIDPVAGGGGYLVRIWDGNRQHWQPLAQTPVDEPSRLYGRHAITIHLRGEELTTWADGELVLSVPALDRTADDLDRAPCRGAAVGVQAWATTEVTVEAFHVFPH